MKKGYLSQQSLGLRTSAVLLAVLCPLLSSAPALAGLPTVPGNLNQESAQNMNGFIHNRGSDDSVDECTRHAMMAFMNLAALNIPGAFSNGYHAYGNYINSEKMDDLESRSQRARGSMTSAAANGASLAGVGASSSGSSAAPSSDVSGRPKAEMDPSFLYKGETGQVAEEFEKKTGMKRETFFQHLASGIDSKPTWSDPNLMEKLESRFNAFKNDIPNKEFRQSLETAAGTIPAVARNKIMGEIAGFYFDAYKGSAPSSAVAKASDMGGMKDPAAAPSPAAREPASVNPAKEVVADPKLIAAANAATLTVARSGGRQTDDGYFMGMKSGGKETINEFLANPVAASQDSIFQTVSKRYRLLMPSLLGKASVLESR